MSDANQNQEICCECGKSVKWGSGRFINRVPVFDDYATRVECGHPHPEGTFFCAECEEKWYRENADELVASNPDAYKDCVPYDGYKRKA